MIDGLILSFQLFSRIPIKKEVEFNNENLRYALRFLPLIGMIIGGITGFVVSLFSNTFPLVSGSVGLFVYFLLSGGLHLDGLSDTVDGFLSNKSKEETLDIMKDSLIGTFGTLSLILYCILKFSLYSTINYNIVLNIALASGISRFMTLFLIKKGEYVREKGFGKVMKDAINEDKVILIINLFLFILFSILNFRVIFGLLGSLIVTLIIENISKRKIGGLTGDIYGLNIEVNEIVVLFILMEVLWI